MTPTLHIHLLGPFLLLAGDYPVMGVNTPRLQALLACLVLGRQTPHLRPALAFLFWPDSTEAQALTNLRKLVHDLRSALPDADAFLRVDGRALQWRADAPYTLDVADFEEAVAQAETDERAGATADQGAALQQAVAAYHGELLPGVYADWVFPERERLRRRFLATLEQLTLLRESGRDYQTAIGYAQRLLAEDPLHEATYRYLMRLHLLNEDRAGALHTYHTCVTVFQRELGAAPSAATRLAYERLLAHDTPRGRSVTKLMSATAAVPPPLVGRQREWAQLQTTWQTALGGQPTMVLLTGEGGIGKTRLAEEFADWATRQGVVTSRAHCYAAERSLAYAPLVSWLRDRPLPPIAAHWRHELSRLLPELVVMGLDPAAEADFRAVAPRQRLFDAVAHTVLLTQPRLCIVDDLQWCDPDTLECLHYLLRTEPQAQLLLVGTARTDELPANRPLQELLSGLRRHDQLVEIELRALDAQETRTLAQHVTAQELPPRLGVLLYQETEGNPLFTIEMLRAGLIRVSHGVAASQEPTSVELPPSVQAVLTARLAPLSPVARDIVDLLATIGREFTVPLLIQASDQDEAALIAGLDDLWHHRVIRERGADRYDFSHGKLRDVAYANLSPVRRRMLHRRVAAALRAVAGAEPGGLSGQIAWHYEQGGQAGDAIRYYLQAADAARAVYANQDAIATYRHGIVLASAGTADGARGGEQIAGQLLEGLGDILDLTGAPAEAQAAYQQALDLAAQEDPLRKARLLRKLGTLARQARRADDAAAAYRRAAAALGDPGADDAAGWQEWLEIQMLGLLLHDGQTPLSQMMARADKIRPVVDQYGTPLQRSRFARRRISLAVARDRAVISDAVLAEAQQALAVIQESSNLREVTDARFVLGFCLLWRGDLPAAEEQLRAAVALAERTGDAAYQAYCWTYLALIYRRQGQVDAVREYSRRVLETAGPEIQTSLATARANLAWIAWRRGEYGDAEEQGRAALALWPPDYPVQWTGRWPLLAVALRANRLPEAVDHARMLVDPQQFHVADSLHSLVTAAIAAWDAGNPEVARGQLNQAIAHAQELAYL